MKYILVEWYPSLPDDWDGGMVVERKFQQILKNYYYIPEDKMYTEQPLDQGEVENNPQFWEKDVEKEYEICSLKSKTNGKIIKDQKNIKAWETGITGTWEINSIKRLSDGKLFSVGDEIYWNCYYSNNDEHHTIKKLYIKDDDICMNGGQKTFNLNYKVGDRSILSQIKHCEDHLFKTEDGVFIDEHFERSLYLPNIENHRIIILNPSYLFSETIFKDGKNKVFYHFDNAEKYLEEHILKFSMNDIRTAIEKTKKEIKEMDNLDISDKIRFKRHEQILIDNINIISHNK